MRQFICAIHRSLHHWNADAGGMYKWHVQNVLPNTDRVEVAREVFPLIVSFAPGAVLFRKSPMQPTSSLPLLSMMRISPF